MSEKIECLCGSVQFDVILKSNSFGVCHCGICRTWSGGPAPAIEIEAAGVVTQSPHVKIYSSSPWGERGFCGNCGTQLFFKLKNNEYANIPLGLLKNTDNLTFETEIFIDRKPACYSFSNNTQKMTEAEFFASLK